jgi:beta-lactamase class D
MTLCGLISTVALTFAHLTAAPTLQVRGDWQQLFTQRGVEGTLVVLNTANGEFMAHDPERAKRRFVPASTFKVPNSLIGLETGAFSSVEELLRWDGVQRSRASLNRDHNMRSAIRYSVVWFFQELARRAGHQSMSDWVRQLGYGNQDIGSPSELTRFWLSGPVAISALEQVEFLDRLRLGDLPASQRSQRMVREILHIGAIPGGQLRAKTGWALRPGTDLGWYVGWLDAGDDRDLVFAMNVDMTEPSQSAFRQEIVLQALATIRAPH